MFCPPHCPVCATKLLVGRSLAWLHALVLRLAASDVPVLVLGRSGTGKECVAHAIHVCGPRASGPFVARNCAAIPADVAESELFGHAKGAFTGAVQDRAGVFEAAAGGTVLLDEIADMPASQQPKLLRVIQERRLTRVGASAEIGVTARIVCATNRDVAGAVASGDLREDLYFRIRAHTITLPPLAERPEDIPDLAAHFVARAAARVGRPGLALAPDAAARLVSCEFPGNVRDLEQAIEAAADVATSARIEAEHLPAWLAARAPRAKKRKRDTKRLILDELKKPSVTPKDAARKAGVGVRYVYKVRREGGTPE